MATGADVRKSGIDRSSIDAIVFDGFVKSVDNTLYVTNSVTGDETVSIDPGNIDLPSQLWKTYTINPTNPIINPYSFINSENIKKDDQNHWLIRILMNGIELDSDEFTINVNKRTVTLNLPNGLTIDNTDELKIWYVKE